MHCHPYAAKRAFTLVELLIVVLIISLLLTVGASVFRGAGGKGVTTATATVESLFDEARSVAMTKGTRARVLINAHEDDKADSESDYLRRILVAYEELDAQGTPIEDSWVLIGRGYSFPPKVFFSRELSELNESNLTGSPMTLTGSNVGGLYRDKTYLYYEFNAEGICSNGISQNSGGQSSSGYDGSSFVVGAGIRNAGEEPRTTGEAKRDFGGFQIWRNGSTSAFRDPEQITGIDGLDGKNF